MTRTLKLLAFAATALGLATGVQAQDGFSSDRIPNIAAVGIGGYPDYIGSKHYKVGGAPLLRMNFGTQQYLAVEGNIARVNVLSNENIRFGPAAVYRFGRSNVHDKAVDRMKNFGDTVELGGFVGYDFVTGTDPRNRWSFNTMMTQDVGGKHKGNVASGSITRWFGVGRAGVFGLNAGTTYGSGQYMDQYFSVSRSDSRRSGLKKYEAGSGFRDVRAIAMFIQPLSRQWAIGAGGMYQRLVGDAKKSPVVKTGSKNQFYFGAGIGRLW